MKPMKTVSKLLKRELGQATVELALVTPILMIIVVGIFEFGRAWNQKQVITNAVRDGARVAALTKNSGGNIADDSATKVITTALNSAGMSLPNGQPVYTGFKGTTGTAVTVSLAVPYTFTFLGPLLQWTTGQKTISLATKFTMRNE
jgi:Flp pilus assembly protein TadG